MKSGKKLVRIRQAELDMLIRELEVAQEETPADGMAAVLDRLKELGGKGDAPSDTLDSGIVQ
jgi:hypothetical protein